MDGIVARRPYLDRDALRRASDEAVAALDDLALEQALAGHPRIGERSESEWSRQEQAGAATAGDELQAELVRANAEYEQRFGHVYLVCATGKSAAELLEVCRARLANPPDVERRVVREELAKINALRLDKLVVSE